jgi:Holliday junction DNA helicase RuvA
MIGYLTGKLISLKPTRILLDVNGVGYAVNISINTFENISDLTTVSLFVYTSVKEDSISLFGFFTEAEKQMFELLISVTGIGPKLALSILSGIKTDDLKDAILRGDITRIVAVPGIGRKTGERLVLELKNKVDQVSEEGIKEYSLDLKKEAVSALTTLGYNAKTADKVIRDILVDEPNIPLEDLIKKALNNLSN